MPRTLVETTPTFRRYRVTDGAGQAVGEDIEYILTTEQQNAQTIINRAATAVTNNQAFLAISSPTAAQVSAQVNALTRQVDGIIRYLFNILDGTD